MANLGTGEVLVLDVKRHWFYFFWPIILTLLIFPVGVIWLIYRLIRYFTDEFIITNKRVHIKTGIFSKRTMDTPLAKINNYYLDQGFIGRFIGYGNVAIQSAAFGGIGVVAMASDPNRLIAMLSEIIENAERSKIVNQAMANAQAMAATNAQTATAIQNQIQAQSAIIKAEDNKN